MDCGSRGEILLLLTVEVVQEKGKSNELITYMEIKVRMCKFVRIRFNCKAQISGLNKVEIYLCLQKKSRSRLSRTGMVVPWSSQIPTSSVFHPEDSIMLQDH